ncbi:MAG: TldD/PmbA family protein [Peptococcaceae bacterium]|nr:TldD/PmbA family protein [Peptococcaceae bacterium]
MIGQDRSLEVLESVLKLTSADQAEVRLQRENLNMTRFANSSIHQNLAKENTTVSVRLVFGKKIGTATVNSVNPDDLKVVVETAERFARLQEDDPDFVTLSGPSAYICIPTYYAETGECTPDFRAAAVDRIARCAAKSSYKAFGAYSTETSELAVANSLGVRAYNVSTSAYLRTVIMSSTDTATGYADQLGRNIAEINPQAVGEEAVARCSLSHGARDLPTGEYEVVLTPYAVSDMVRFLGYLGFSAMSLQEGRSFMAGKLGQQIIGSNISIWDDAMDPHTLNMPFDIEGAAKRRVRLIENGIATGAVYDSYTAHKGGITTTGHSHPRIRGGMPTNMVMAPGDSSLEEMIQNTKRGIYITRFHYTHCPEPVQVIMTGTTRDGTYYIEDGEIKYPVKNLRLTDSVLRVFSHVSLISREQKLQRDWWNTFTSLLPALKAEKCNFTGVTTF